MTTLPDRLEAMTLIDAAASVGVELRGEDGQPFHCGTRMEVRGGIVGADYVRCACGVLLTRVDSPHTNGGFVLTDEAMAELGERCWVADGPTAAHRPGDESEGP